MTSTLAALFNETETMGRLCYRFTQRQRTKLCNLLRLRAICRHIPQIHFSSQRSAEYIRALLSITPKGKGITAFQQQLVAGELTPILESGDDERELPFYWIP